MNRVVHPDLPRCTDCGNTRGPWTPTGDRDDRGAQTFRCAPGTGCSALASTVAAREPGDVSRIVAANLIKAMDPSGKSLVDLATAVRLEPRDLAAALGGQRELTLAQVGILAHVLGVGIATLFTEGAL